MNTEGLALAIERVKTVPILAVELLRRRVEEGTADSLERYVVEEYDKARVWLTAETVAAASELETSG